MRVWCLLRRRFGVCRFARQVKSSFEFGEMGRWGDDGNGDGDGCGLEIDAMLKRLEVKSCCDTPQSLVSSLSHILTNHVQPIYYGQTDINHLSHLPLAIVI